MNIKSRILTVIDKFENVSPLRFFIISAVIFGSLFIVITPPFQTPDEPAHFLRINQVSSGNLIVDEINGVVGGTLPNSLKKTINYTTSKPAIEFAPNVKYDIYRTEHAIKVGLDKDKTTVYDLSATALYPPSAYLPQSLVVWFLGLFNAAPIILMYSARIANLVTWIVLLGVSIKLIPRRKWTVVFIGLLPMALFQATSLGIDVMASGLAILFVSYILFLNQIKKIKTKQLIMLTGIGILMTLTKQTMFILLPMVFLLQSTKFKTPIKSYVMKFIVVAVPLFILAIWLFFMNQINIEAAFKNGQDPVRQIYFVIKNPHSFINVLWNTNFFVWGDTVTRSFIGSFGWLDTPLSEAVVVMGYISMFIVFVSSYQKEKSWFTIRQKQLTVFIMFAYWLSINAALYVYYSPVAYKIIVGMQGRYFIPLLILATPLLRAEWLYVTKKAYSRIAIYAPILLLVASIITLYFRYYVNNV